ncbi:double-strand break repair helicase AddA [Acuticoccus kandeliae]|uniref:double-strand break repair helicase AddA n=1 Tax=Acuticoccus kandeliae TaxID=2073160 RepID=UPI000D3ECF27|nr:double-strand break repair helicase AddA [Acuticoccus kandeliae]
MAEQLIVPPEADAAQRRSSDPGASVWVSANAGAGKTYVLAQRVVRLLLAGVAPRSILCLTYTNAAAAEMAQRVFAELARLSTLPDAALAERVAVLAPEADPAIAMARARTLFAEALETPGGLKVQTLHAFAAALLRRFPLEANISGSFQVLDDGTREELTDRAIATVLAKGATEPDGPIAAAIEALLPHISDGGLSGALRAVLAERQHLAPWLRTGTGTARLTADLEAALGIADGDETPCAWGADFCRELLDFLTLGGHSRDTAERLASALGCEEPAQRELFWAQIFLKDDGAPRAASRVVTKPVRQRFPALDEMIEAEQARLAAWQERQKARNAIAATVPLVQLAWQVLGVLEAEKRRRGLIDYDDQIERAMNLVRAGSAAAWVRFKLDEGVDHVMVDEAQDTSPPQWQMVEALTEEFFAGHGAREAHRTLFVVGDEKQSIYSFQGAAPDLFAKMRDAYGGSAAAAGIPFHAVDLAHSMRSSPEVLSAVDRVFRMDALAASVRAAAGSVRHIPVRSRVGGVDVWPLFSDTQSEQPKEWYLPFDHAPENAGMVKLVRAIADQIEAWCAVGPDGGAPIKPGDVMILARKRAPFATLMNRELKRRGIPTAGSDRLDVTAHIAVQDMLALARALVTPDDLSLAAVLKSPLFGFGEEDLFAVAHGREGTLLAALAAGDARAVAAHATLLRWGRAARRERPFDFLASILIGEGRRADFAARMGSEAEDALDALLDLALEHEGRGIPSLETFLLRLSKTRQELRRAAEGKGVAVRVMTVHGSKGLEAPVVFLADVGSSVIQRQTGGTTVVLPIPERPEPAGSDQYALPLDEPPARKAADAVLFAPTKAHRPALVEVEMAQSEVAERAEHHRLLYVGMTRAERHLVICGAYRSLRPAAGMWHEIVTDALGAEAETIETEAGPVLRWRHPDATPTQAAAAEEDAPPRPPEPLPAWLGAPAPHIRLAPEPLAPSAGEHEIAAAPALVERRPLAAAEFGTILHVLLEREGESEAEMAARVAASFPDLLPGAAAAIVAEARAALALDMLGEGTVRREVDVTGDVRLPDGSVRRVTGRIDRLQFSHDKVLIVDFKTDRAVPERAEWAPEGYRLQLAIYRALVVAMCPGRRVSAGIVWTAGPRFMDLDGVLPVVEVVTGTAAA